MTDIEIFAFATINPNALVKAYHPKAMPVILTTLAEVDIWLLAPIQEAKRLQRPLAGDSLIVVGRGRDGGADASAVG